MILYDICTFSVAVCWMVDISLQYLSRVCECSDHLGRHLIIDYQLDCSVGDREGGREREGGRRCEREGEREREWERKMERESNREKDGGREREKATERWRKRERHRKLSKKCIEKQRVQRGHKRSLK